MTNQKMKEVKKNANIALYPSLKKAADGWAASHKVSISAIASTALKILLSEPLDKKELIVEEALRAVLNAAPSASEAQVLRRIAAIEKWIDGNSAQKKPIKNTRQEAPSADTATPPRPVAEKGRKK